MEVTLKRAGNVVLVQPWVRELEAELTCRRRERDDSPQAWFRKDKYRFVEEKLYFVNSQKSSGVTFGGLLPRVRRFLEVQGHKVTIDDRQELLPEPDWERLPPLRKNQPEIIASILAAPRGLLEAPTGLGKSFVISALVRLFPQLTFLIVTKSLTVCQNIYRELRNALPDAGIGRLFGSAQTCQPEDRVIVATTRSFHKYDPDKVDVLIFDEAHNVGASETVLGMSRFTKSHLYGFTATPTGRSDETDMFTEAFFGQVICKVDWGRAVSDGNIAQVRVVVGTVNGDVMHIEDELERLRRAYWHNQLRNRTLIGLANEVLQPSDQVIYYVDRVEHGLCLRPLLPGVPFVHAGISPKRWEQFVRRGMVADGEHDQLASVKVADITAKFRSGELRRVIATSVWKEGVDFPDLSAVVRFDGGRGMIDSVQIGGRLTRIGSDGRKKEAILIDVIDNFGKVFMHRSQARLRAYRQKGWPIEQR